MIRHALLTTAIVLTIAQFAPAAEETLTSPGGQIRVVVASAEDAPATLTIYRHDEPVMRPVELGLIREGDDGDFTRGLSITGRADREIDETWQAVSGARLEVTNRCREMTLSLTNPAGGAMELIVRAYDEGAAFRYRLQAEGAIRVTEEATTYRLPGGSQCWAQAYRNNYENEYHLRSLGQIAQADAHWGHPILVETPENLWLLLTEADVVSDYAVLHFVGSGTGDGDGILRLAFPPDQREPISAEGDMHTPWRVVMATEGLGGIVESDLIRNLASPSRIQDTSWIRPGRVAWSWWSDHSSPRDLDKQKAFVDLASAMGWEYSLVDEGWRAEWVPELVEYARQRDVGIILWRHARSFSERDARQYAEWGVVGVKLDFIDSDSQAALRETYDRCFAITAEYELMLNFHGATKPFGETRTWPHNLTREGVKGGEYRHVRAPANVNLVYTRNVLGPMDYTPVILSRPQNWLPTTFGHQLAHAVLFESGLQHYVDTPEVYLNSPARPMLEAVPAIWDETVFIDGRPDQFAGLARRRGDQWFVGLNTVRAMTYRLRLDFLPEGQAFAASIYADGDDDRSFAVSEQTVTRDSVLPIDLRDNGGCTIMLQPSE